MSDPQDDDNFAELRKLYPDLSVKELREADLTLTQYFELAWEIYEESVLSKRPDPKKILSTDSQVDH